MPTSPTKRRITSQDVAKLAGVSRATVSYVLNNSSAQKIPDATRQKVLQAAADLNYAPSSAARTLRSGRSDIVLCVLPSWPMNQSASEGLSRQTKAFAEHNLTMMTYTNHGDGFDINKLWTSIAPAALLMYEGISEAEKEKLNAAGVELVITQFDKHNSLSKVLNVPEELIGQTQIAHLHSKGHQRLGYCLPADERLKDFAMLRLNGVIRYCEQHRLPAPLIVKSAVNAGAGAQALQQSTDAKLTALCAYDDDVAMALLAGARLNGINVPNDMAIVGVDNSPASSLTSPTLTTVAHDYIAIADYIAAGVISALNKQPSPTPPSSASIVSLIQRESS